MLKQLLLIGLGGGIGSILRYVTSVLTIKYNTTLFPLATFTVNMIGCLIIGLLIGWLGQNIQTNQHLKLLFITGFCGGFTTFSTFAWENFTLIQHHHYWTAILYVGASIVVGLIAVVMGFMMTR